MIQFLLILTTLILLQLLTLTNSNLDRGPGRSPGGGWGAEPPKKEKKRGGGGAEPPHKKYHHIYLNSNKQNVKLSENFTYVRRKCCAFTTSIGSRSRRIFFYFHCERSRAKRGERAYCTDRGKKQAHISKTKRF